MREIAKMFIEAYSVALFVFLFLGLIFYGIVTISNYGIEQEIKATEKCILCLHDILNITDNNVSTLTRLEKHSYINSLEQSLSFNYPSEFYTYLECKRT